jgi:probable O-glycosylation ligase (exosortase A-associated)
MKGLLFTYGLTYGGAVVSLFNPYVGLLIYVCFAILRPQELWFWSVPEGNYSKVVAIALLVGWALKGFGDWRFGRAGLIVAALVGFLGWAVVSALTRAANQDEAWRFIDLLAKIVLPFLVGVTTVNTLSRVRLLVWVIMLSEAYLALEFNLTYLGGYNRLKEEGFGSMDNNCNAIALVTCLGLAVLLMLNSEKWWQKALAFGSAALIAHAVMFSFSRGGMLAALVTGGVIFLIIPKRPAHYLAAVVVVLAVMRFAGPEVIARFSTVFASDDKRDASAESRLVLWKACLDTMQREPLGVGPGNWGEEVVRYGFKKGKLAHTLWLQVGAELGVIGLGLLVSFYGLCVARLLPMSRESYPVPDPEFRHLARAVIASLVGFAVSAQFVSLDLLEHPYYVCMVGACLLKLESAQPVDEEPAEESAEEELVAC